MASSAQQGFVDPYNYVDSAEQYRQLASDYGIAPGGFISKIGQFFGVGSEEAYENMKLQADREYERQSINSARAWDEYMDSTKYQRAVEDMKAAGLNPWLAVQNGLNGSAGSSADTGGSAQHQNNSGQAKTFLGMLLLALAKAIG